MTKFWFLYFWLLLPFFATSCCNLKTNFVGMTRLEVASLLEKGPKTKKGKIRIAFSVDENGPLVIHWIDNKNQLLYQGSSALKSKQWQVFYHLDRDMKWHSYIITFLDDKVINQEERRQPYWVMSGE